MKAWRVTRVVLAVLPLFQRQELPERQVKEAEVAVAAPIDVRYSIERINNIDYVTNDQFQQGLQQAAAQGAQRGEQNTLKRLQMSGSTRRRLGM